MDTARVTAVNDLCAKSATSLAAAIASREVSCTEVLEAHLAQIAQKNPSINAVAILDADGARSRARDADTAVARGERLGRLHGVPFTLKDAHATAGMRSTTGFPPFDHVPREDGTVAARLKAEGAILIGKTNVPPLLADHQTANEIFGCTNNPADLSRTPGGSSGGAAAAIASYMTPLDVGTDLSSSIRLPAHFCGVYGLKPTEHRVSLHGVFPIPGDPPRPVRIMTCVGPLARTIDDIELVYSIIAGPDNHDTDVVPIPLQRSNTALRVGFISSIEGLPVANELRELVERVAKSLDAEPVSLPIDAESTMRGFGELLGLIMNAFGPQGDSDITLASYFRALATRDRVITAWESFFQTYDVLITPPAMSVAFPHDDPPQPNELLTAYGDLFNYSGHPAMVIPCGTDGNGLPMAVQIVGPRYCEDKLFALAQWMLPNTITGS